MITAAHHTMFGPDTGIKPPYDWSYNTVMNKRDSIAAKTTRNATPTIYDTSINLSNLGVSNVLNGYVALSQYPGKIGVLLRFSDAPNLAEYCIIDPVACTLTRTDAKMTISSSNLPAKINMNRDGRIFGLTRYDGGVYSFNQDGSNCVKHGTCEPFSTSRGIRLAYAPEGGFIAYGEESTTRHLYRITESNEVSLKLTWASTNYYFYTAVAMPDYWVFTNTLSGIIRMDRNLSNGTYISSIQPASYACLAGCTLAPLTRNHLYFGMTGKPSSGKLLIGYNVGSNTAVTSNTLTGTTWNNPGAGNFCCLPTGEFFGAIKYESNSPVEYRKNDWFIYNYETDSIQLLGLDHDSGTAIGYSTLILPTGQCLSTWNNIGTDGCLHFKIFDWGFNKKQVPVDLLYGPYGMNFQQ